MRIPRPLQVPRFALLIIITTAAAVSLLFWSRRYVKTISRQSMGNSSSKAKECLKRQSLAPHNRIYIHNKGKSISFAFSYC